MVRAPIIIQASIVAGIAIAIQAGLDFLGLGDLTIPTWGNMLNDGFSNMYRDPQLVQRWLLAIAIAPDLRRAHLVRQRALRDELERSTSPTGAAAIALRPGSAARCSSRGRHWPRPPGRG